jgi:MFS family permease
VKTTTPESKPPEPNDRIPLYSLLGGNAISQVGNSITILAGPWFVLQTTGSAAKTGIVAAALTLGAVILAVLGGPIVDRLGFRRASIAADLGSAALIGAVPVLHLAELLQFWHLVILVFLLSSVNAQGDTARYALVPALAERAAIPIERANGIDRAAVRFGQVGGPLIGGLLIAWMGATNVLFVDVGTFTASALLALVGIPALVDATGRDVQRRERDYRGELREGLRFIKRTPAILWMALVGLIANFFDKALLAVIAPVYADRVYGSATSLGLLVGAFGIGAFSGSLLFGAIGRNWPRRLTFLTCFTVGPLVIYGTLAMKPPLAFAVVAALVAGLLFGPINPIFTTVIQSHTPPMMLGRVFGTASALAQAGIPVGATLAGVVVQQAGLIPTIVGMGSIYVGLILTMFLRPALHGMDEAPVTARTDDAREPDLGPTPPATSRRADVR